MARQENGRRQVSRGREEDRPPSHLLTVRRASKHLGMSRTALRALLASGQVPVYRHNGRVLIDPFTMQVAMRRMRQQGPLAALALQTIRGGRFQID